MRDAAKAAPRTEAQMRTLSLPLILAAGLGLGLPAAAQSDFDDVIGGIAQSLIQQEMDRTAYIAAQEANTAAAYRDYLRRFPRGQYRANAERALAGLGTPDNSPAVAAAQAEARLGITFAQRVAVQRELTRLGYNTYGADGVWGRNTRSAIATWQRDRGDPVTGYVTAPQLQLLARVSVVTPPAEEPPASNLSAAQAEAALRLTRAQRTEIQRQLTTLGHDAGVADGLWGTRTRAALRSWQRANDQPQTGYITSAQVRLISRQAGGVDPTPGDEDGPALEESLLDLTREERRDLQIRLTRLGYDPLRTDGTFGAGTRRAIIAWQEDGGMEATGYLTADQVRQIRVDTGG
jgi:peptidoglycan hydrolase-like protein with peptidoglycan-binding domain